MIYQIVFLLIPLIYFHFYYKKFPEKSYGNFKDDFIEFFGFNIISWNTLKKGLTLAFILIFVFFLIGIIYSSFIASDTQNVNSFIEDSYESLGWLFIILLIVSAFSEELFFRSFLVERFGIFISSVLFALMHISYSSWFEVIGAFILGLILALYWKKERDFFVVFIGHLIYNLFIVFLVLVF